MNTQVSTTIPAPHHDLSDRELLRLADQCVKCGYCLPHCPTYIKTRNEADSPRGRISLIQGWLSGELQPSAAMTEHLDGCLGCRACETVCPSLVAYGQLADAARARRIALEPGAWRLLRRLWLRALSHSRIMWGLGKLSQTYVSTGLARLAERAGIRRLRRLFAYHRLGTSIAGTTASLPSPAAEDSGIDLFVGCMGSSALGAATNAAIRVCERLGLAPRVPPEPSCCGGLMRHNGFPDEADRQRAACAHLHADRTLVGLASACIAEIREQPGLEDTQEICAFLDTFPWPPTARLERLERRVVVHEPCSHRNSLGGTAAVYRLLERIPGLVVAPLAENDQCCGAAGTYLLQHPEMAGQLLEDKLDAIRRADADILVTTNPGCALHLIAGIREAGLNMEVVHPIELIDRQLRG